MDVSFLQKNYILVVLAILFSVVYTLFMNFVLPQQPSDRTFIKTTVLSIILSSFLVYIHTLDIPLETISLEPPPF